MIDMTGEISELVNNALAEGVPCVLGSASKDGHPQISMKGSLMVYDRETLAYWERSMRSALDNVAENPNVVVLYRNPGKRINWRFYGTAKVHPSGAIRKEVMRRTVQAELDRDSERRGVAVLVRVDKIAELSGNVLQER